MKVKIRGTDEMEELSVILIKLTKRELTEKEVIEKYEIDFEFLIASATYVGLLLMFKLAENKEMIEKAGIQIKESLDKAIENSDVLIFNETVVDVIDAAKDAIRKDSSEKANNIATTVRETITSFKDATLIDKAKKVVSIIDLFIN